MSFPFSDVFRVFFFFFILSLLLLLLFSSHARLLISATISLLELFHFRFFFLYFNPLPEEGGVILEYLSRPIGYPKPKFYIGPLDHVCYNKRKG